MSRNMISYVRGIFSRLADGIPVPSMNKARLLPPAKDQIKKLTDEFSNVKFSAPEYLAHNVKFFTAHINEQTLFCLTNLTDTQLQIGSLAAEGIYLTAPSEAIVIAALLDANISRSNTASPSKLEEEILFQQEDSTYEGHSLSDILPYFETVHYFIVDSNSPHQGKDAKDVAYFISSYDLSIINPNLHIFLTEFRGLLSHPGSFMKQNIFWSMTATHYKHVFLELYRCIENIYSFPHALALKNKMGLTLASYEIARHCADELGWKRKEELSLIKIFHLTPSNMIAPNITSNISNLKGALYNFDNKENKISAKKSLAKLIYQIRNQMVHQFELNKEINITPDTWIDLIKLLIPIIDHIYTAHASELPNKPHEPSQASKNNENDN